MEKEGVSYEQLKQRVASLCETPEQATSVDPVKLLNPALLNQPPQLFKVEQSNLQHINQLRFQLHQATSDMESVKARISFDIQRGNYCPPPLLGFSSPLLLEGMPTRAAQPLPLYATPVHLPVKMWKRMSSHQHTLQDAKESESPSPRPATTVSSRITSTSTNSSRSISARNCRENSSNFANTFTLYRKSKPAQPADDNNKVNTLQKRPKLPPGPGRLFEATASSRLKQAAKKQRSSVSRKKEQLAEKEQAQEEQPNHVSKPRTSRVWGSSKGGLYAETMSSRFKRRQHPPSSLVGDAASGSTSSNTPSEGWQPVQPSELRKLEQAQDAQLKREKRTEMLAERSKKRQLRQQQQRQQQ
mmetsp:Transcript_25309/g.49803  ORF Transcript_25309/g.49803 Transcript_25309/m.49803 type:complete len:358 (+) Transcript_25309:14-1087(+)